MNYTTNPIYKMHPSTGKFTDGDPGGGIPASLDAAALYNAVWDELINLINAAGLTPDEGDFTQVAEAVAALITEAGSNYAAANHSHDTDDVTGLDTALAGKAPTSHTHNIDNVNGLQTALNNKAALNSPALSGTPTAPTQSPGNNTTRIATTAFVAAGLALKASLGASVNFATVTCSALNATTSDETLKKDIHTVSGELVFLMRGVDYTLLLDDKKYAGVIAQEIQKIAPHLVTETKDGTLAVYYDGLFAYVVEGMKADHERIATLEARLQRLEEVFL